MPPDRDVGVAIVSELAGWIALAATAVAAVMTAANLGARVTGWGFAVFLAGAIAWIVVGVATDQRQLLYSNLFLAVVDLIGIWRWLGRRARLGDATDAEVHRLRLPSGERFFSALSLDGLPVRSSDDRIVATVVDALVGCRGGSIDFLLIRTGGIGGVGERLLRLPWSSAMVGDEEVRTELDADAIASLAPSSPA